jgi:hypothetical protein
VDRVTTGPEEQCTRVPVALNMLDPEEPVTTAQEARNTGGRVVLHIQVLAGQGTADRVVQDMTGLVVPLTRDQVDPVSMGLVVHAIQDPEERGRNVLWCAKKNSFVGRSIF